MIKCALFDLDGTLVDTSLDLGRATAYVLESFGRENKWSDDDYRRFVGNGARKLIERAFEHSLTENEVDKAFAIFKVKYNEILLDNAYIYDGIRQSLEWLKQQDIRLAVVTNKPHKSAVIMVESLFGKGYFDYIIGASDDMPKKPNPYTTHLALEALGAECSQAIYFGDSDIDIYTANNAGVIGVGCTWGFRSRDCIKAANPYAIIDKPCDIPNLFKTYKKSVDK